MRAPLGVVFCGGKSARMGRDKAGLVLGGRSLLDRAVHALAPVADEVVLACGPRDRYTDRSEERVLDRVPDGGPLAGLESGLVRLNRVAPSDAFLVALACDLPGVDAEVFRRLLACARETRAEACLLESSAGLEPLCAVYHASLLPAVRAALDAGERRMISFHGGHRITTLPAGELPGATEEARLWNVNTPEDFEELGGRLP